MFKSPTVLIFYALTIMIYLMMVKLVQFTHMIIMVVYTYVLLMLDIVSNQQEKK
ncbi:unnamed protein product [Trichobilharzia regenti]|nr:unnamed protein product [Trichobilharzia regenti]